MFKDLANLSVPDAPKIIQRREFENPLAKEVAILFRREEVIL